MILRLILSRLGYAKVPNEAVELAMQLRMGLEQIGAETWREEVTWMLTGARALEKLLRSCKYLTRR
jgi:hypothetical protein